jgi:hypothetical protein
MFAKYFKTRFDSAKQSVQRGTKGNDVKRCHLIFVYEFSDDLAQCLGPRAVAMQKQLMQEKDAQITAKSIGLELDTATVSVSVKHKNPVVLRVAKTIAISATAKAPTASMTTPSIKVELIAEMTAEMMDFAWEFLNECCYVRLDRQQLEIPNTQDEAAKEEEGEADAE